jgi:isopentenyl-diphosphate delta-isomerase type 1
VTTNPPEEMVVLVDENDVERGTCEKIRAHREGVLHRAFSAFVFRTVGSELELLLQQRASTKYHFGGLWTNTCCGHPRQGETPAVAGRRRLKEEMGFDLQLQPVGKFVYTAQSENGLFEHECDHVLLGNGAAVVPNPDPNEASAYRWIGMEALAQELAESPASYTPWFAQALAFAKQSAMQHLR